jgi:hypothetical protein
MIHEFVEWPAGLLHMALEFAVMYAVEHPLVLAGERAAEVVSDVFSLAQLLESLHRDFGHVALILLLFCSFCRYCYDLVWFIWFNWMLLVVIRVFMVTWIFVLFVWEEMMMMMMMMMMTMPLFDFIDFDSFFLMSKGRTLSIHLCGDYDDDDFPFRFLVLSAYML